jgi:iron complex outermembrane receptor protein
VQGEWRGTPDALLNGLRVKLGHTDYRHTEFEPDGAIGTVFTNRGYDGRADLLHGGPAGWNGAIGVQVARSEFGAKGDEAFLPPAKTHTAALFAFEELARGPLTWQFGARFERTRLAADGFSTRRGRDLSASIGQVWKLDETWSLAFSAAHTERTPNSQELFARGPHTGTQAFEIGHAALGAENSLGLEASLRRRTGAVTGALTFFAHDFRNYLFAAPTGEIAHESDGEWEIHAPGAAEAHDDADALPVYRYVAREARFWGAELEALWHLHEAPGRQLDLRFAADLTRAREGGRNLPRIPAARATVGLIWAVEAWSAGVDYQRKLPATAMACSAPS